jgi:DsbC/DsbD-like thiol-disulfide interchange protein/cytochrome c biogenesis protein CcdA
MLKGVLAAFALMLAFATPAAAQLPVAPANVQAELVSARAAIAPGETFTVALRQTIRDGWHTYWRNPGAAGEPTMIEWSLPPGFSAGDILWPAPHAIAFGALVNFGYADEILLPVEITAPRTLRPGQTITLTGHATWVVCSDICVFEEGDIALSLPVEASGRDDATWAPRIAEVRAALPVRDPAVVARITPGNPARLSVALPGAGGDAYFFPFSRDVMDPSSVQDPRFAAEGVSFALLPGVDGALGRAPIEGVVTIENNGERRAYEITAEPGEALFDAPVAQAEPMSLVAIATALGLAFLGGLILNIMPCVLPVLSVKALSLAGDGGGDARKQGLFYFAGVMVTFLALAGLLIALRSAGEAVGWGFQLQAPWVTSGLALLFFVIGLNLLGVFEIGGAFQNAGANLTGSGSSGSFFTGALAVVAATPCTAPFMAGAIGVALTQSAATTLLIFAALALGFALPLTLLHVAPSLQRLIPKPGAWMERAKQVLAFPMFATAIWLAWVLAEQVGAVGVQSLLNIAAALAFVLFVSRWGRTWLIIGAVVLAGTVAISWRPILGMQRDEVLASEPWTPERLQALRDEGRPVFVNFTAAWCITCKANELAALRSPRVAQAFQVANVAYLEGDWTNRDDTIAAALAAHGRVGVPLYLYYPPGGEPRVLPQVLTEGLVIDTISGDAP